MMDVWNDKGPMDGKTMVGGDGGHNYDGSGGGHEQPAVGEIHGGPEGVECAGTSTDDGNDWRSRSGKYGAPPLNGRNELKSRGTITNYFNYTPHFKLDMTPTSTKKLDLGCEKEDLGNVGAGGFNGKTTVDAWKQLLALKPNEGGKFKPKIKKISDLILMLIP